MATPPQITFTLGPKGRIELRAPTRRKVKALRHYTNHCVRKAVEIDLLAHHVRSAVEPLLPPGIAQHHDIRATGQVLSRTKIAPENRSDPEGAKEAVSHSQG